MSDPKIPVPNVIVRDTFLEAWAKGRSDPIYFVHTFLDRDVHGGQERWLLGGRPQAKERVWAAANRIGKTTVQGYELVRRAFYQIRDPKWAVDPRTGRLREYIAMSVAMSLDQARLAWNVALTTIQESPKMRPFLQDTKDTPFPLFTLATGERGDDRVLSEVWARSTAKRARYLLGRRVNFLSWDECAWDPDGKEIFDSVIKMRLVDQGGDIDFTSTPNAKNWFYEQYQLGLYGTQTYKGPRYYSQTGTTIENTFISQEDVELTARLMTRDMILQNIFGEFIELSSIFPWEDVARCYRDQEYRLPVPPGYTTEVVEKDGYDYVKVTVSQMAGRYVVGVDLGRKQDPTCIVVLKVDLEPVQVVSFELVERPRWALIYEAIKRACDTYKAPLMVDSSGLGDPIEETLRNEPYNLNVTPFIFSVKTKENLILQLQEAIQKRRIVFPYIEPLVKSMTMYAFADRKLFTDPVMALALAWRQNLAQSGRSVFGASSLPTLGTGRRRDLDNGLWVPRPVESLERPAYDPLAGFWADEDPVDLDAFEREIGSIRR